MTLQHYRPGQDGSLEPAAEVPEDYRTQLRSRRWNAAPLENPEVEATNPWIAVLAIAVVSAVTFVLLLIGYGSGFWG
jgi:hypothetical protein